MELEPKQHLTKQEGGVVGARSPSGEGEEGPRDPLPRTLAKGMAHCLVSGIRGVERVNGLRERPGLVAAGAGVRLGEGEGVGREPLGPLLRRRRRCLKQPFRMGQSGASLRRGPKGLNSIFLLAFY